MYAATTAKHKTCLCSSPTNPSMESGRWTWIQLLAEELSAFGSCWGQKGQFSLRMGPFVDQPQSRTVPVLKKVYFQQHILVLMRGRNRHKGGCVGDGNASGRSWWWGCGQTTLYEVLRELIKHHRNKYKWKF